MQGSAIQRRIDTCRRQLAKLEECGEIDLVAYSQDGKIAFRMVLATADARELLQREIDNLERIAKS